MRLRTIAIAGGNGKIARILTQLLADEDHRVLNLIRNPKQSDGLVALGGEPIVLDLESADVDTVAAQLSDADVVVFAAGAGPGSGAARKQTVDYESAVLMADAAEQAGVRRFLQISAMGVDDEPPAGTDAVFAEYLRAKAAAEADLRGRRLLDWTIIRPGLLTDDEPTGLVELSEEPVPRGAITRSDVAAVLAELIDARASHGKTLTLVEGETDVLDAVGAIG